MRKHFGIIIYYFSVPFRVVYFIFVPWIDREENWVAWQPSSCTIFLSCNSATGNLAELTVGQMKLVVEFFFSNVGLLSLVGAGTKDLYKLRFRIHYYFRNNFLCCKNWSSIKRKCIWLWLQRSYRRIIVAGSKQDSNAGTGLDISMTSAVGEVVECRVEKTAPVSNSNTLF